MSRMIFDITDKQRNRLEGYRHAFGHRSLTAALHALIEQAPQPVRMDRQAAIERILDPTPTRDLPKKQLTYRHVEVSTGIPIQLGPSHQAPGSRLKTKR